MNEVHHIMGKIICQCQNDDVLGVFIVRRPPARLKMLGDIRYITSGFVALSSLIDDGGCGLESVFTISQARERGPKEFRALIAGKTASVRPPKAKPA